MIGLPGSTEPAAARPRTEAERRRAVERLLAREGLVRGPRPLRERFAAERPGAEDRRTWSERMAVVLTALGPAALTFGRYLALRPDVLGAGECRRLEAALAAVPEPAELPPAEVEERLLRELGHPPDRLFSRFDPEPLAGPRPDPGRVDRLSQVHAARLAGGEEVRVRIAVWEPAEEDLAPLDALAPALPTSDGVDAAELISAFRLDLADRLDHLARVRDLARLAAAGAGGEPGLPAVPEAEERLSTSAVLTTRAVVSPADGPPAGPIEDGHHRRARSLYRGWLRLALGERAVVIGGDATWGADGRWWLEAPRLATLPEGAPVRLGEYLSAVAAHDPEAAFEALAGLLEPPQRPTEARDLARRMRQAVPFGDSSITGDDLVADHALLHWRLIRRSGFRPRPALEAFYRGLLWAVRAAGAGAGEVDPEGGDPLREAVEDAGWRAGWDALRDLAEPDRMRLLVAGHLEALTGLPRTLERAVEALERMERSPDSPGSPRRGAGRFRRARGARLAGGVRAAVALAAAMGMAAVAAWLATAAGTGTVWTQAAGGGTFVALAGLLLRAVRRGA